MVQHSTLNASSSRHISQSFASYFFGGKVNLVGSASTACRYKTFLPPSRESAVKTNIFVCRRRKGKRRRMKCSDICLLDVLLRQERKGFLAETIDFCAIFFFSLARALLPRMLLNFWLSMENNTSPTSASDAKKSATDYL